MNGLIISVLVGFGVWQLWKMFRKSPSQNILPPPPRFLFGTVVWLAWAVIGTLNRWSSNQSMPLLIFIPLAYGPLIVHRIIAILILKKEATDKFEFLKVAGNPKYSHFEKGTAITLDGDAGTVA